MAVLQTTKVVELVDERSVINGATLSSFLCHLVNLTSLIARKYLIDIHATKEKKFRTLILLHSTIPGMPESGGKTWQCTSFLSDQDGNSDRSWTARVGLAGPVKNGFLKHRQTQLFDEHSLVTYNT